MNNTTSHPQSSLESRWARLGVLFNCDPSPESPDIERVLLDTARDLPSNPRLYPLAITWLIQHGLFVARHRLKHLITTELEAEHQPALGLLLDEAIAHGAPAELRIARDACRPHDHARPLFGDYRSPSLAHIAESQASDLTRKWGLWAPPVQPKPDAVRPPRWILAQNPTAYDRIVRRGDLRASILEALRLDFGGVARSLSVLGRATGATRVAVRSAVESLVQEGAVTADPGHGGTHEREIELVAA